MMPASMPVNSLRDGYPLESVKWGVSITGQPAGFTLEDMYQEFKRRLECENRQDSIFAELRADSGIK